MRHVISAVEIIVDVDLPVAVDVVSPAIKIMKLADAERSDALHQSAKKFLQRRSLRIEIYEHKTFPGFDADGKQTVLSAIKVFDSVEFGHAFERAIQAILPAVIRTLQHGCLTAKLGDHGGGVMPADVVKTAQRAVASAHDYYWLSGEPHGHE